MKKKVLSGLLTTALLGGFVAAGALSADAATYGGTTDGSVTFTAGTLVPPPTEDDKESGDVNPDNSFGLWYVPSEFGFANTILPTAEVNTESVINIDPAVGSSATSNPATKYVAVGDARGQKTGWMLDARIST